MSKCQETVGKFKLERFLPKKTIYPWTAVPKNFFLEIFPFTHFRPMYGRFFGRFSLVCVVLKLLRFLILSNVLALFTFKCCLNFYLTKELYCPNQDAKLKYKSSPHPSFVSKIKFVLSYLWNESLIKLYSEFAWTVAWPIRGMCHSVLTKGEHFL